jgi:hypothetical protein
MRPQQSGKSPNNQTLAGRSGTASRLGAFLLSVALIAVFQETGYSQVQYSGTANYSLRKVVPGYNGNAIQVRRSSDNATADIGFLPSGALDTIALKSFVLGSNPLGSLSVNAALAYSLRKMRDAYAGSAIQVRRSSDNATLDIGFTTTGDLDTSALKAFVGAGNSAFVTVWYDQSGNGINVAQPTQANQPRIVNAGLVDRKNGVPAILFDGLNDFFTTNSFPTTGFTGFTSNILAAWTTTGNIQTLFDNNHTCTNGFNMQDRPDLPNRPITMGIARLTNNACRELRDVITTGNGSLRILSYVNNAARESGYRDGTLFASGDWAGSYVVGTRFTIGGWHNGGNVTRFTKGTLSEFTLFKSALSNTDRQSLEESQSLYYRVAGPVSGGTTGSTASAFVTTWYDQSGNGRHVTNATPSRQPQIMNAGMLYNNANGNPSIYFNGGGRYLAHPFVLTTQPVSTSCIFNAISLSNPGGELFGWGNNSGRGRRYGCFFARSSDTQGRFGVENLNAAQLTSSPLNVNTWYVSSQVLPGANLPGLQQWINGSSQTMSSLNAQTPMNITSGEFAIGTIPVARVQGLNGYMPEMSYYAQQLSNTRRILIESNQSAYYNLGIANSKYAPPASRSHIHYVNGVGRESATDKVTETSQSAGMGFMVGMAATDFLKDNGDYLACGMNTPFAASSTTSNLPPSVNQRWLNDWYLTKTDVGANNGQVTVYFDFSDYGLSSLLPGNASSYVLLGRKTPAGVFAIVNGTTASVAGDQVRFLVDASNLRDGDYYTLGTIDVNAGPLPVNLLSFAGTCEGGFAKLNWATANETNNDYFAIEGSADGVNFNVLGRVSGNNSQSNSYSYTDKTPLNGSSFFRLRQTDFDGQFKYSKIVAVNCKDKVLKEVNIYPNPVSSELTIEIPGNTETVNFEIMNATGAVVYKGNLKQKTRVPTSNLPSGTYLIRVSNENTSEIKRIIKN